MESNPTLPVPSATFLLVHLLTVKTGIVAVRATHEQINATLTDALITLANRGKRIGLIVANSRFGARELARRIHQQEHLQMTYAETPTQVRYHVQLMHSTRSAYSVIAVVGLLESFHDEQIKENEASLVLEDSLSLLNEMSLTLRVLIVLTPSRKETRPHLLTSVHNAVDSYLELKVLPAPKELQGRLF